MALPLSNRKEIIMNFGAPPNLEDILTIARGVQESLPEELIELTEELEIQIEDMADEAVCHDMDVEDPFELLTQFKSAKQLSPGVEKKEAEGEDILILYRRPVLDFWCESEDHLADIIRQVMIEELGNAFDFPEEEIEDMLSRHHQGLL